MAVTPSTTPLSGAPPAGRRSSIRSVRELLAGGGLALVIAGTFLPWVISGGVLRNSYAIVGIAGRLGVIATPAGALVVSLWPFIGPITMLAWVAGILRLRRTAAAVTLVIGMLTGVIGAGVLAVAGGHSTAGVGLAYAGPVVTVIGAVLAIAGAVLVLIDVRSARERHRVDQQPGTSRISGIGSSSFPTEFHL